MPARPEQVLGDPSKRSLYDSTGIWEQGAEEELLERFAQGLQTLRSEAEGIIPVVKSSLESWVPVARLPRAFLHHMHIQLENCVCLGRTYTRMHQA